MAGVPPALIARLKGIVGPKGWIDDAATIAPCLVDSRGAYRGATPLVVRPRTTAEVCAVVRRCAEAGAAIVPQGGNTGRVGGAVPSAAGDEIVLSLSRLAAIRSVDPEDETITVEAGCVLSAVQQAAEVAGRLFPLSLASEGSCQIGGAISTNAGGTAVLRYGMTRELVLGLEVVLPDGRLWDGLRGLRKDNTGYDLKQLFIGAEGTLGVITAAVLRLFPKTGETATALVAVPDIASALAILGPLREASGNSVSAFELIPRVGIDLVLRHIPGCTDPMDAPHPWYVLAEVASADRGARAALESSLADAIEAGRTNDAVLAESNAQAAALWRLRDTIPEAETREGASIKHDIAVLPSRVAAFMDRARAAVGKAVPGVRFVSFGHLGDGNIHFNLSQPEGADGAEFLGRREAVDGIVFDIVADLGGSVSAEHGIGQSRRAAIRHYKSAVEIELMQTLKAALDPDNIMNPGKLV
jgi:FAD/FMN-containing dehydrogenase